jgi:uncharacterized membrane protein
LNLLILGLVLFIGSHSVSIFAPGWRDRMVARMGEGPWKGIYSLVAIAGVVLIVMGYGEARHDVAILYHPAPWLRHVSMLLMLFVFPLLLATYLPGRIKATLKHPMLVATKTWAFAHLLVNGTSADVLLFGSILAWAVVDRISLKRRTPRPIHTLPATKLNDVIAIVGGLAIYAAFVLWWHGSLMGVPLMPSG